MRRHECTTLVTGAARGIGAATAVRLAAAGCAVECLDQDPDGLRRTVAAIVASGGAAEAVTLDLGAEGDVRAYLDDADRRTPLERVALCAGVHAETPADAFDIAVHRRVLDVDLNGPAQLLTGLLPRLRRAEAPRVVVVSSIQAHRAEARSLAYGAAKAGVEALVRSLAVELGREGILVNAVAPGFVDTPMSRLADGTAEHETEDFRRIYLEGGRLPLGRPAAAEEIAHVIAFLLSRENTYITGHSLVVDGGLTAGF
jgi:3-oxoacyl-[acyl-carrier protein] reductase